MKKNRLLIVAGIILLVLFLVYFLYYIPFHSVSFTGIPKRECQDTILAKKYIETGDKLKGSKPDSSIYYYKKAIDLTNSTPKEIQYIKALSCVGLSSAYCNLGNYPESGKYDSIVLSIGRQTDNKNIIALGTNLKGLLSYKTGDFSSALKYYRQAQVFANEANNRHLTAKIFTNIGIINYLQGDCKNAYASFSQTLTIALSLDDKEVLAGTYLNLGLTSFYEGDYRMAAVNYGKSLEVYRKINGKDGMLLCYQNLGGIYFSTGDFTRAFDVFGISLKLSEDMGDRENIAKAHQNLGEVYGHLGDLTNAMDEYIKSVTIKEQIGDKQGMTACLSALGALQCQQKNYKKAYEYYQRSLQINKELNLVKGLASDYANIANVCSEDKQSGKSYDYFHKALQLYQSIGNKSGISEIYISLGGLYRDKKDFKASENYYFQAIQLKKELSDTEGLAMAYNELAELYVEMAGMNKDQGYFAKAVTYGLNSYHIAEKLQVLPVLNKASLILKEAYGKSGNLKEALKYSGRYETTNDSLLNKSKLEAITFAEARWNVERKQRQIEKLESEKKLHQEIIEKKEIEAKRERSVAYSSISLLVLVVIASVSIGLYLKKRRDMVYQKQLVSIAGLKMQNARNRMSPHFFFNVLSSISGSAGQSGGMKARLNDMALLLRKTLENIEQTAIPLEEELSIVKTYIELQRERIPGSFNVDFRISEKANLQLLIPAMIIQIPVENAIKHGLMMLQEPEKNLKVSVEALEDGLKIIIDDNGIGMLASAGRSTGTGTGLKVLMQTIHLLNSKNKIKLQFSINDHKVAGIPYSGTLVEIIVPENYSYVI